MEHLASLNRRGTIRGPLHGAVRKQTMRKASRLAEEEEHVVDAFKSELTKSEVECVKMNFSFYDRKGVGHVELFELPMLLNICGYDLTNEEMKQAQEFFRKRKVEHIDTTRLISLLCYMKDLELEKEQG